MDSIDKMKLLDKVFSPTAPIKEETLFRGRITQIKRIVEIINEDGQHGIIYGERGVGKTSLANITCKSITNTYPVKVTCNSSDNFKSIWIRALNEVKHTKTVKGIGFTSTTTDLLVSLGNSLVNKDNVEPHDVTNILRQYPDSNFLFVFDEFDNIRNATTRQNFADLIKSLSDNSTTIKILIVGISDNVADLIGNHRSLERCLMQIYLPRMSDVEQLEIIEAGFKAADLEIAMQVKNKIVKFSSGFPHYTHLLCKYAGEIAINEGKEKVSLAHLNKAISKAISNTSEQLKIAYGKGILSSTKNSQWKSVIYACALCKSDEFDTFSTHDVLIEFNKLTEKNATRENITHNLEKLCQAERGRILTKLGSGKNVKYKFEHPMMKPYILLNIDNAKE